MRKGIKSNTIQMACMDSSMVDVKKDIMDLTQTTAALCQAVDRLASGYLRSKMSLNHILPFETNDDVRAFCVIDGKEDERREALLEYLRVKGEPTSITKYVYTLSRAVFDPEYMARMRWPSRK